MKFFPFEDISYRSKLDSEEILRRLKEITEPRKIFRMTEIFGNNDHKHYEGEINKVSFKIARIIGYRNSFLPRIEGVLEKEAYGTKVNVKMRLHLFVFAFMLLWCAIPVVATVAILYSLLGSETTVIAVSFLPLIMTLFGYGITLGGFKYESIKSKKFLAELFEAEIEE